MDVVIWDFVDEFIVVELLYVDLVWVLGCFFLMYMVEGWVVVWVDDCCDFVDIFEVICFNFLIVGDVLDSFVVWMGLLVSFDEFDELLGMLWCIFGFDVYVVVGGCIKYMSWLMNDVVVCWFNEVYVSFGVCKVCVLYFLLFWQCFVIIGIWLCINIVNGLMI